MPKIPLYAEGRGSAVDLATGRLGPQAPTGAFEAPGQATVRAAEALGRVGTEYAKNAMQFENARQKLEFDFQMKRKEEKTRTLADEFQARAINQSTDYSLNSTEDDMDLAASGLVDSVQNPLIDEINLRSDITDSQKTAIIGSVNKTMVARVADIKKTAFQRSQVNAGMAKDAIIGSVLNEAISLSSVEDLNAKIAEGFAKIDEARKLGQPVSYNRSGFEQEMRRIYYAGGISNADSFGSLEEQKAALGEDTNLNSQTRAMLDGSIESRRKVLVQQEEDRITDAVRVLNPSLEEIESIRQQLRDPETTSIVLEREAETINIPFAGADANFKFALAEKFDRLVESEQREILEGVLTTAKAMVKDMSLNALQNMKDDMTTQKNGLYVHFGAVTDNSGRDILESVIDREIRDKAPRELARANTIRNNLYARVVETGGVLTDRDQKDIFIIQSIYTDTERFAERDAFNVKLNSTINAASAFRAIEFASPETQKQILDDARDNLGSEVGSQTFVELTKLLAKRDKAIKTDFVGYWQTRNRGEETTAADMIALQRQMGVPELDIRVTSNNQLNAFRNEYDQEERYDGKAQVLQDFLNEFGTEQNRVQRHLHSTKTITLVENVLAALGGKNINAKPIFVGNSEDIIKRAKSELESTDQQALRTLVSESMGDYTSSILGGVMSDDVLSGGVTKGRATHTLEMRDIVYNTAAGLKLLDPTLSLEDAKEAAFNAVIGSQYRFDSINGSAVRFDADWDNLYADMTDMLEFSLVSSEDYLRSVVKPPPRLDGQTDQDYENYTNEYFSDLKQRGSWRTSVDNESVYMVDQLGNVVELLDSSTDDGAMTGFLTTRMDEVAALSEEYRAFKALGMDAKRKKLVDMGYPVDPATLQDGTANNAWKRLTFAKGPLF